MAEYISLEDTKKEKQSSKKQQTIQINSFVLPLIFINVIIFFIQLFYPQLTTLFSLNPNDVFTRPWILLTSMFLHGSFAHLFFNMYALFLFGIFLESKIKPKRFLIFYLITGLLVGLLSSFFYTNNMLGASGAIMGVIGMLIMLMPNLRLYLFFIFPIKLWQAGILWFFLDFFGMFSPNNVANLSHIFGLLIGLGYGYYLIKKRKKFFKKFAKNINLTNKEANKYKKL